MEKIQEILDKGWIGFSLKYKVPKYIRRTMDDIGKCKTKAMGSHKYVCDECGHEEITYNSCKNRSCPNCQAGERMRWIEAREEELLNVKYYHVVFTIPSELNMIALQNEKTMYKILFKASAETMKELAGDKKYLGGEIGFFSVLHTWGQTLQYHPHVHLVVTGGGLNEIGKWVERGKDFFIPVKVLAKKFRGKFISYMKQEKLNYYGENKYLENPGSFENLINTLYSKNWVVYCKEPFKDARCVIKYLGRYTHRVAISNQRIKEVTESEVKFKYKDYKDGGKTKEMSISIEEFIYRFLVHILPPKFMKIRYYGILGNKNKKEKLEKCKKLTKTKIKEKKEEEDGKKKKKPMIEILKKVLGDDFNLCPSCKKGHMIMVT